MHNGYQGAGSTSGRRRAFRPNNEGLEDRRLLATTPIDLGTIQGSTTVSGLGVETVGAKTNDTAGYTVTDVGDVNGSGYDSFVVSAPGLASTSIGGTPDVASATNNSAYLVFGSRQVNQSFPVDFLTLTPTQRAADLAQLGQIPVQTINAQTLNAQTNPTVIQPASPTAPVAGFNFDGLKLTTSSDTTSGLGFSVSPLGDLNGDGVDDFAISAPNDAGGGRVFVIYGGTNLTAQTATVAGKTLDLEATAGVTNGALPTKVVSFAIPSTSTITTAPFSATNEVGYAVTGIGNYFNTTQGRDLGIGVPGLNGSIGAAYAVAGAFINGQATGTSVNLAAIGTTSASQAGIVYTGVTVGDRVGASLGTAGSFDGAVSGNQPLDDFLIGAPAIGTIYLVYSRQDTTTNSAIDTTMSLSTLGQVPGTNPITTPLQGVVFIDQTIGDRFGFSLSTAGDFNNDGAGDFIVGAPGYLVNQGAAVVVEGVTQLLPTTTRINGTIVVNPGAPNVGVASATAGSSTPTEVSFTGQITGAFAGYSVAASAHIAFATATGTPPADDILIGEPGFVGKGSGDAFLIPGYLAASQAATFDGMIFPLATASATPVNGVQFYRTAPTPTPATGIGVPDERTLTVTGFGSSVSARNPVIDINTLGTTLDNDTVPDLFFGAPLTNYSNPIGSASNSRPDAGVAFAVEGSLIGGTASTTTPTTPTTGGTGSALSSVSPLALSLQNPSIFTGDNAGLPYPTASSLSHLTTYQPLPVQLAYNQFLVAPGFKAREEVYHHPGKGVAHQAPRGTVLGIPQLGQKGEDKYNKVHTYPGHIFRTSKFKVDKTITFTHKVKVIPRSEQTETFTG